MPHADPIDLLNRAASDARVSDNLSSPYRTHVLEEAAAICRGDAGADPDTQPSLLGRGLLALRNGEEPGGVACLGRATELAPTSAAWTKSFRASKDESTRSPALLERDALDVDLAAIRRALSRDPYDAMALGRLLLAVDVHEPEDTLGTLVCLGAALERHREFEEAEACYLKALALKSDCLPALTGLGRTGLRLGKPTEAATYLERALTLDAKEAWAHLRLAWAAGLQGDLDRALQEMWWYFRHGPDDHRYFEQPAWDGSPLDGRTLLLWADADVGEAIQALRYPSVIKTRGTGRIIVECPGPLVSLAKSANDVDAARAVRTPLPSVDFHAPLTLLPATSVDSFKHIPACVPYVKVESSLVAKWRRRLGSHDARTIGIVWSGDSTGHDAELQYVSLAAFAPLTSVSHLRLFSLQPGKAAIELLCPPVGLRVEALHEATQSLADAAALIMSLDLVLTVDTTVVHLAGALGRPVWTLLAYVPNWRWRQFGELSLLYPTMRLFRQTSPGDWRGVFERVRAQLERGGPQ